MGRRHTEERRSGFVVLLSTFVPLSTQWLHYGTPGIPRMPDGKANLSAPAPKTPDGCYCRARMPISMGELGFCYDASKLAEIYTVDIMTEGPERSGARFLQPRTVRRPGERLFYGSMSFNNVAPQGR